MQSKVRIEGSRLRQVGGFGVIGMAERLGQHARKVQITQVRDWPLCTACTRTRRAWLTLAGILFFGGFLTFATSLVVAGLFVENGTAHALAGVAMAGFVATPLAAFPFARGSITRIIGASTAPEGGAVLVENPSKQFCDELPRHE